MTNTCCFFDYYHIVKKQAREVAEVINPRRLVACKDRLGLEDGQISDAQITASSEWASNHGATNARLNRVAQAGTTGAWSAKTNDGNQWIQAALGRPTRVTGVLIQGRPAHRQWVTKFKVQSSNDGEEWTFVQQANGESIFDGNTDQTTVVTNLFHTPVTASYIRILPTEWNNHISMRFELLGCEDAEIDNYVCEHSNFHLECPTGQRISVSSALYGRKTSNVCTKGPIRTVNCAADNSLDVVRQRCEGQETCDIQASNGVFGDPCGGTFKYLEIQYSCDGNLKTANIKADDYVCEHSNFHLECPTGQRISVSSALYGRKTSHVCTNGPIRTVNCAADNSLHVVQQRCEGQETCDIQASNGVFGDPCGGTFKYLEIQYSCEVKNQVAEVINPRRLVACKDRLGLEDGQISDAQITASSEWASNHGATNARLNRVAQAGTTGAWSARTNDGNQWIQAAFGRPTRVTGVLIQGRPAHRQWVTKFKVQSSDDGEEWTFVQQANGESIFDGNTDQTTVVTNFFHTPVTASYIRILPTEWNNHISMRFELLGCEDAEIDNYVCEHSNFHLECPTGQKIAVSSALYGRKTSHVCTNGPIRTVNCAADNSLDVVRQRCEGQEKCDIQASNGVFGDPCGGTFKYLEIEYSCEGNLKTANIKAACKDRLGLESGEISDDQITASSEWASNHGATNARLNRVAQAGTTGAWSARTNDGNQWIQAALGRPTRVTGVLIQGRPAHRQWVTKFKVQSSDDGEEWIFVQQANGESVSFYLHVYLTNCACALFFFLLRNKNRKK
ncbi:uncharacterized protein [Amphiura filiformis]|uniref:uncharacterized protein n=1 Tax=Amphiura filiformis TaxID=82378 RepID=UPI003B21CADA